MEVRLIDEEFDTLSVAELQVMMDDLDADQLLAVYREIAAEDE